MEKMKRYQKKLFQDLSKKKKGKPSIHYALEQNGAFGAEDKASNEVLVGNEFVQKSSKKKRKSNANLVVEENGAFEAQHPTSRDSFHLDAESPSRKKKSKKQKSENLMYLGDSLMVTKSDGTMSSSKKLVEPVGISSTKQPEGKYFLGSLSRLFSGFPVTLAAEETAVTISEGETIIRSRKGFSDNVTRSKELEVQSEIAVKMKDRLQQRANRKKAREQQMTLEEKKRTIFVANAPLTMNERSCRKLFSQYGKVESVRMRSIFPSKETITKRVAHLSRSFHEKQTSLIFYVKFEDEDAVQKALAYNGTILEGHRIRVDTCTSKAQYDKKLTVFVGNIPLDAKEDDLANIFEENIGDVSFVRFVKDQSTGLGKGFAFVVFKSPTSVPLALSTTGLQFHKRELRIMKVMKKKKIANFQSLTKGRQISNLTKEQSTKIDQYKFSTRKSQKDRRPRLKKNARKAIQMKKIHNQAKSFMQ